MKIGLDNFENVFAPWDLELVPEAWDVGGGIITKEEIDQIRKYPEARSLQISGLKQDTFEYLIANYGDQFEAICFHKNKLVSDLSLLSDLQKLKYVYYYLNQKATSLWNMSKNDNLMGVCISNFSKLQSIEPIKNAPNLEYFSVENPKKISLAPLLESNVKHLSIWGGDMENDEFLCLSQSKVKALDLNICCFKVDELAKIVASIPGLKGTATQPYRDFGIKEGDESTEYYLTCKGKRNLTKGQDDQKFEKYLLEFEALVERYRTEFQKEQLCRKI